MSAALRRSPGIAGRIGRIIAIVLVFVVVGPLVGGPAFMLLMRVAAAFGVLGPLRPEFLAPPSEVFLTGILFGYVFGAGPVAVAGLAIGIKQAFFGPTSWWMALAAAFLTSVILIESLVDDLASSNFFAVLILSCVVSVLMCWMMVRDWYFAASAKEALP